MFFKTLLKPFLSRENKPVWFIMVDGKKQGPFSINDLKKNPHVSPLTLVWKKGFKKWVPMGSVDGLRKIFESRVNEKNQDRPKLKAGPEIVLEEGKSGFFPSMWWLILAILIAIYTLIKLKYLL